MWEGYKISLRPWEFPDIELLEYEESEQFAGFAEEPRPYDGCEPQEHIKVAFVDGVRRTEYAFYLLDEQGTNYEGAFASVGAGAILLSLNRINLIGESMLYPTVKRYLVIKGNVKGRPPEGFELYTTDGDLSKEINRIMREELEVIVSKKVAKEVRPHLIICDGTLSNKLRNTPCVGYVKTIKKLFISKESAQILNELKRGQRTPLIKVHYQERQEEKEKVDKYTWYVKLTDGEGIGGLARLEVFSSVGLKRAIEMANLTAGILPKFVSSPYQDDRAPQNLLPIKSLENFLRKHLGSYSIIRRAIEKLVYA